MNDKDIDKIKSGELCPACFGTNFIEHDCGPDTYDDDITYTSHECSACGLWFDGWRDKWLVDVHDSLEEDGAKEFPVTSVLAYLEEATTKAKLEVIDYIKNDKEFYTSFIEVKKREDTSSIGAVVKALESKYLSQQTAPTTSEVKE